MPAQRPPLSVRLPPKILESIGTYARSIGATRNGAIVDLVEMGLEGDAHRAVTSFQPGSARERLIRLLDANARLMAAVDVMLVASPEHMTMAHAGLKAERARWRIELAKFTRPEEG